MRIAVNLLGNICSEDTDSDICNDNRNINSEDTTNESEVINNERPVANEVENNEVITTEAVTVSEEINNNNEIYGFSVGEIVIFGTVIIVGLLLTLLILRRGKNTSQNL